MIMDCTDKIIYLNRVLRHSTVQVLFDFRTNICPCYYDVHKRKVLLVSVIIF
jgi:hypothetical protein